MFFNQNQIIAFVAIIGVIFLVGMALVGVFKSYMNRMKTPPDEHPQGAEAVADSPPDEHPQALKTIAGSSPKATSTIIQLYPNKS